MTYHAQINDRNPSQWAVVGSDGATLLVCTTESSAQFYCDLLNARANKTVTP